MLRETQTSVPDVAVISSDKYHHISNLPFNRKLVESNVYLTGVERSFTHKARITCFMCGNKISWAKMSCSMTCSSVEKQLRALPGQGNYYLNKWRQHCKENNHCYFYFTVTDVNMEEKETTKVFIQRALFRAVKLFGGSIPDEFFRHISQAKIPRYF